MHKNIIRKLIKNNYIDKVIIVPTADNYAKPNLLKGTDRYNMLKSIFKEFKDVDVSSFEVDGSLYTINTLNHFAKLFPNDKLFFICGTDNFAQIETWKKYQKILGNYNLLVIPREIYEFDDLIKKHEKYKEHIVLADIKQNPISSTAIRKLIAKRGYTNDLKKFLYVDTIKYLKMIDAKKYWR